MPRFALERRGLTAHLLDGTPLTDLVSLGGILDRRRRFVVDGAPVVTGLVAVGDAWACTNPSLGRGITMGLMHAAGTREVVRRHLDDPLALARAHDEMTERRPTPWYSNTVELDRVRGARLAAAAEGRALPEPTDPAARIRTALPEFEEVRHLPARIASKNAGPVTPEPGRHRYTTGKKYLEIRG